MPEMTDLKSAEMDQSKAGFTKPARHRCISRRGYESIVRCIEMGRTTTSPKPCEPTLLKTRVKTLLAMEKVL